MIEILLMAQLAGATQAAPCEALKELSLPNTTVQSAILIPEGIFEPPPRPGPPRPRSDEPIPAHCQIKLVAAPTSDSRINIELWLPVEAWNGKLLAVGNGGWAGAIQGYGDMQMALRRGYATAATDTGHSSADGPAGMFALGHLEKLVDFAFRAVHEMSSKSKRIIHAYYDDPLEYSYFKGCSTGGRQAVMAAQRYPGDFDGIIAGALANRHIHMHTVGANRTIELTRHPERALSQAKADLVNEAVMNQCDIYDEGFLNNPRQCRFDFDSLQCTGSSSADSCLTPDELQTVKTHYEGVRLENGELIFSGQALGNPIPALKGSEDGPNPFAFDTIRILGFQDPDYDWRDFDLEHDMRLIDAAVDWVDAVDPDLRAFEAHGGKLLLYAGWRDTGITPENTIFYYESVLEEMGENQDDWMRLFLAPGMGHCRGGPGINTFDTLSALELWREQGVAPSEIAGHNPETGAERPLCPYPAYADYDGSGDLLDADNWSCVAR